MKTSAILLALLCVSLAPAASPIRIACGSSTGGTDAQGHVWQADAYFAGGTAYTSSALSAFDLPYRALRYSATPFSYAIPASDGDYTLTLSFVENRTTSSVPPVAAGQRKFSVSASGGSGVVQVAASNLDLYAVAGSLKPYSVSIPISIVGGKLFVTVAPDAGNALLSGIQLEPVVTPPVTSTTITCERTLGDGAFPLKGDWVYPLEVCVNTTANDLPVLRVLCRSDAPAILGVMARDAGGRWQNVVNAFPCALTGSAILPASPPAEGVVIPGTVVRPNQTLLFVVRVLLQNEPASNPGYGNARQVLMTAVLGK